jgi:hypothetical protein
MTDKPKFGFIHYAVVLGDWLEKIPVGLVGALLALLAAHIGWIWTPAVGMGLAVLYIVDAAMLALLPQRGKSFGPLNAPWIALAVLRWGLAVAARLILPRGDWALFAIVAIQAGVTAAAWYGLWIEPFRLGVTRLTLTSPKLNGRAPIRLLHLSDLHVERITPRERQLLQLVDELRPDLIVFTGDFLNLSYTHDERAHADCRAILAQLRAPLGVYAISGSVSVDPPPVVRQLLDRLGIHRLDNQVHAIKTAGDEPALALVGVTCTNNDQRDGATLARVVKTVPNNPGIPFTLLLYHTPDLMPQAAREGVDLYLCGHTHGGQVRLPLFGALVTSSKYWKRYEMGRYTERGTTLYVSRGIGLEGRGAPRARFLCPPEIGLIELRGE